MLNIEDANLFMMCREQEPAAHRELPIGYHIRTLRRDELPLWKRFPFDGIDGDLSQYINYMTDYFDRVYAAQEAEFYARCLVICDIEDRPVGTCFAWKSFDRIWTIHWFKIKQDHEGQGLGRALLSHVMRDIPAYPVYLHTQPGSYRAIKLYTDFGFALLTDEAIGHRVNQYQEALPYLRQHMGPHFESLRFERSDGSLHQLACSVPDHQF